MNTLKCVVYLKKLYLLYEYTVKCVVYLKKLYLQYLLYEYPVVVMGNKLSVLCRLLGSVQIQIEIIKKVGVLPIWILKSNVLSV